MILRSLLIVATPYVRRLSTQEASWVRVFYPSTGNWLEYGSFVIENTGFLWVTPWLFWCSVLQCVAVCCGVLPCVAVCGSFEIDYSALLKEDKAVAVCCSVLQYTRLFWDWPLSSEDAAVACLFRHISFDALWRSVLQYVAVCCSVLQYVAVCCSVLQYTTYLLIRVSQQGCLLWDISLLSERHVSFETSRALLQNTVFFIGLFWDISVLWDRHASFLRRGVSACLTSGHERQKMSLFRQRCLFREKMSLFRQRCLFWEKMSLLRHLLPCMSHVETLSEKRHLCLKRDMSVSKETCLWRDVSIWTDMSLLRQRCLFSESFLRHLFPCRSHVCLKRDMSVSKETSQSQKRHICFKRDVSVETFLNIQAKNPKKTSRFTDRPHVSTFQRMSLNNSFWIIQTEHIQQIIFIFFTGDRPRVSTHVFQMAYLSTIQFFFLRPTTLIFFLGNRPHVSTHVPQSQMVCRGVSHVDHRKKISYDFFIGEFFPRGAIPFWVVQFEALIRGEPYEPK